MRIHRATLSHIFGNVDYPSYNPSLSNKFGKGFSGAMAISGLLKQAQAKRSFDAIMDGILESDQTTKLSETLKNINDSKGSVFSKAKIT